MSETQECCPRFDPTPWEERILEWKNKRFVKARVRSFLRIPLNFGTVLARTQKKIQTAGAETDDPVILSDENSLWGSDLYVPVSQTLPKAKMVELSGTFLAQVYSGPYRNIPLWVKDLNYRVLARGKRIRKIYFYYTTCPVCAKKYGKNYVVLFAEI